MATPTNKFYLLENVDINSDYLHSFKFASRSAQLSFFQSKIKHSFTDVTFVRKDSTFKVDKNIESLLNVSYVMFQNTEFGTRWYYAFVKDMKFINRTTTEISFEIDVVQTWGLGISDGDISIDYCLIDREHTASDEIGEHLLNEELATGEYTIRSVNTMTAMNPLAVIVGTTYNPDTSSDVTGEFYTGIFAGIKYFAFSNTLAGETALKTFIEDIIGTTGKENSIKSMFMIPEIFIGSYSDGDPISVANALTTSYSIAKNHTDIDGYTPKNKKLFAYPYNLLYVTNHNGNFAEYHYEYSSQSNMQFYVTGNVGENPVANLVPQYYKGAVANFDEILRLADYPQCSWLQDAFPMYMSQAIVDTPFNLIKGIIGSAGPSQNPIPLVGGVGASVDFVGKGVKALVQSPHVRGAVSGGLNTSIGIQTFGFYPKTIRSEYAEIIDGYFTKFGYKVHRLATPTFNNRPYWTYTKLAECTLNGNVPNTDKERIVKILLDGITFWNGDYVGNYVLDNSPVP